jgi:hypothetical protein
MSSAELLWKVMEVIGRQVRSGVLAANSSLSRNWVAIRNETKKGCVMVSFHGDGQPLSVRKSMDGELQLVTSWYPILENGGSELIEDKKRLTISDAVGKLQQILLSLGPE